MRDDVATTTDTGPPFILLTPPSRQPPSWRRLHGGIIAANVLAAVVGILSIPAANFLSMGLGMIYAAASHTWHNADALLMLSVIALFGVAWVCAACIGISLHFGRRGDHRRAAIALSVAAAYLLLVVFAGATALLWMFASRRVSEGG